MIPALQSAMDFWNFWLKVAYDGFWISLSLIPVAIVYGFSQKGKRHEHD